MSIIKKMRRQKAVYWQRQTTPDRFGKFAFAEPVEIDCRWDDSGAEFRNNEGQTEMSRAVVYPDRIMKPGDRLMKGQLESDTEEDPSSYSEAFAIKRFDQNPNLRATETLFTAYL